MYSIEWTQRSERYWTGHTGGGPFFGIVHAEPDVFTLVGFRGQGEGHALLAMLGSLEEAKARALYLAPKA